METGASPDVSPANAQQLLWVGRSLDMTLTTDQALSKMFQGTNWVPTKVMAVRKSGAFGVACAGGVYTAAGKGGNAIVGAAQTWLNLTAVGKMVDSTLAAISGTDVQTATVCFLSLTVGNTGALTADLFVFGIVVD